MLVICWLVSSNWWECGRPVRDHPKPRQWLRYIAGRSTAEWIWKRDKRGSFNIIQPHPAPALGTLLWRFNWHIAWMSFRVRFHNTKKVGVGRATSCFSNRKIWEVLVGFLVGSMTGYHRSGARRKPKLPKWPRSQYCSPGKDERNQRQVVCTWGDGLGSGSARPRSLDWSEKILRRSCVLTGWQAVEWFFVFVCHESCWYFRIAMSLDWCSCFSVVYGKRLQNGWRRSRTTVVTLGRCRVGISLRQPLNGHLSPEACQDPALKDDTQLNCNGTMSSLDWPVRPFPLAWLCEPARILPMAWSCVLAFLIELIAGSYMHSKRHPGNTSLPKYTIFRVHHGVDLPDSTHSEADWPNHWWPTGGALSTSLGFIFFDLPSKTWLNKIGKRSQNSSKGLSNLLESLRVPAISSANTVKTVDSLSAVKFQPLYEAPDDWHNLLHEARLKDCGVTTKNLREEVEVGGHSMSVMPCKWSKWSVWTADLVLAPWVNWEKCAENGRCRHLLQRSTRQLIWIRGELRQFETFFKIGSLTSNSSNDYRCETISHEYIGQSPFRSRKRKGQGAKKKRWQVNATLGFQSNHF